MKTRINIYDLAIAETARALSLSLEVNRLRKALNIAVSRGCDHCAECIKEARSQAEATK